MHRLRPFLKTGIGLLILALVTAMVPWRDRVLLHSDGATVSIVGTLHGDWKGDSTRFLPSDAQAPLPAGLAAHRAPDGELALQRGKGIDWRPGLARVFSDVESTGLATAYAWLCLGLAFMVLRWKRLLDAVGCRTGIAATLRLTLLGWFFSIVVPGLTGGDLVKAVLVAREHPGTKTEAVVSVFVDRLIGIATLAALAAVAILVAGDTFAAIRAPVLISLLAGIAAAVAYVNPWLRRAVRMDAIIARLPMAGLFAKVDQALLVYARSPAVLAQAAALSLLNHLCTIAAVFTLGRAFGDSLPAIVYFAVVPVASIVSALPLAPGGWGVGEAAYGALFKLLGGSAALGIAMSVSYRLIMLSFGLLGGLLLLTPGSKVDLRQVEREAQGRGAGEK